MPELTLPLILQMIGTTIMILGVAFRRGNLRNFTMMRKREAAILLLSSLQTTDFVRGLLIIFDLPDNASMSTINDLPEDKYVALYVVLGTWERLGILVYHREIDITLVEDSFSGAILQSWQKLERYLTEWRAAIGRDMAMEWFQWLTERIAERQIGARTLPAYQAHRGWKP